MILAIDITAVIISAIGAVVSLGTVALTLMVNKKVTKIGTDVDGKMEKLLLATGAKERAEGKLEEKAEQKAEAIQVEVTKSATPIDVKIVDQAKPVDVTQIKK